MRRAVLLAAVGVLLLTGAALVPVADLLTAEWDRDYVYRVGDEGVCGDVVATASGDDGSEAYTYDVSELSDRGRRHVLAAIEDGSHRVGDADETAPEFRFADDHFATGAGCYVVRHEGDAHSLTTRVVGHRADPEDRRLAGQVGPVLLSAGAASLLAAAAIALAGRIDGSRENG